MSGRDRHASESWSCRSPHRQTAGIPSLTLFPPSNSSQPHPHGTGTGDSHWHTPIPGCCAAPPGRVRQGPGLLGPPDLNRTPAPPPHPTPPPARPADPRGSKTVRALATDKPPVFSGRTGWGAHRALAHGALRVPGRRSAHTACPRSAVLLARSQSRADPPGRQAAQPAGRVTNRLGGVEGGGAGGRAGGADGIVDSPGGRANVPPR